MNGDLWDLRDVMVACDRMKLDMPWGGLQCTQPDWTRQAPQQKTMETDTMDSRQVY